MRRTSDLIDSLVESTTPVRRLAPPLLRTCVWLALAVLILALLCVAHGVRPDLSMRLKQPVWVSTIGYGCLTDWVSMNPNGIQRGEAARCFATLLMTSAPVGRNADHAAPCSAIAADDGERGGWSGDRRHDVVRAFSPALPGCDDHDPDLESRHGSLDRWNGQCDRPAIAGLGSCARYAAAPAAAIKAAMNLFTS